MDHGLFLPERLGGGAWTCVGDGMPCCVMCVTCDFGVVRALALPGSPRSVQTPSQHALGTVSNLPVCLQ